MAEAEADSPVVAANVVPLELPEEFPLAEEADVELEKWPEEPIVEVALIWPRLYNAVRSIPIEDTVATPVVTGSEAPVARRFRGP